MFYERLSQLCKEHGTTVTEVACTHLGVAGSSATNWKKGASPRSDIVIRAAQHFHVSTDYLLGLTDDPALPEASSTEATSIEATSIEATSADELLAAARLLRQASPRARAAALAAMRAVIASLDGED